MNFFLPFFQSGTYTCTAYNDLGNLKSSISLSVTYRPSCRLRQEKAPPSETTDPLLASDEQPTLIRCHASANPAHNISFNWYHNNKPLPSVTVSVLRLSEGAQGSFACEARNEAGLGERCSIKVSGPVAKAVAETDYTKFLAWGIGSVVIIFLLILLATLTCRKFSIIGKYDVSRNGKPPTVLQSSAPLPAAATGAPSNGQNGQHSNGLGVAATGSALRPPRHHNQQQELHHQYAGMPSSHTGETSLSSGGGGGGGGAAMGTLNRQQQQQQHPNGNGILQRPRRGTNNIKRGSPNPNGAPPANTIITGSSTALVPPEMGDPFEDMGGGGGGGGMRGRGGVVNEVTAPVRQRVMNVMQRTYEYGGIRAPRELWLV